MASFKARIGYKMPRKKENIYCRSASFLPNAFQKIPKKKQKSSKKLKNKKHTIMASFRAKIFWKWPRKREHKNYRSVTFLPDALQKIAKKYKKIKKIPL